MITPRLFRQYPTAEIMARAEVDDIFELVRSVSYPRAKAGYLVAMAQRLVADHQGEVPEDREELMKLPGVGRKTANVIASVIYNRPTMAVDTHVFRVSNRIGLTTNSKTPLETELTLIKYIPEHLIPQGAPLAYLAWTLCMYSPQASVYDLWISSLLPLLRSTGA